MTVNLKINQTPAVALYSGLSSAGTSVVITPYPVDLDGVKLTMADFGSLGYMTIDPKISSYEEIVSFTGMTDNGDGTCTLTGLSRDLQSKYPYTGAGTGKTHGASAIAVFSNNPQIYGRLAGKDNDETITGSWSFPAPTIAANPATKSYVDTAMAAGGLPASSSIMGISKLTTNPNTKLGTCTITIASPGVITLNGHGLIAGDIVQFATTGTLPTGLAISTNYYVIAAGLTSNAFEVSTTVGGTALVTTGSQSGTQTLYRVTPFAVGNEDTRLLQNAYVLDTGSANAYAVTLSPALTAYATGQVIVFMPSHANTTASTINANAIGTKNIFRNGAALSGGEIQANQLAIIIYDGTQFELFGQAPKSPPVGGLMMYAGASAPAGWLFCDGSAVARTGTYANLFAALSTTYGAGDGSTTFNLPDMRSRLPVGVGTGTKTFTFASRASNVITATGMVNSVNNEIQTGQAIVYTAASPMTGLVTATTYYLIRIAYNQFSLATSVANAIAGTAISLSSDGSGSQTFLLTFSARALADTGGEETHGLVTAEIPAHSHVENFYTTGSNTAPAQQAGSATATPSNSKLPPTDTTGGSGLHNVMSPFLAVNYIIKY